MNSPALTAALEQASWVHRMARVMVRDPHVAADIAQDAIEAGLRVPGREIQDPRAWLAGALRNLHRQEFRRRKTRRERPAEAETIAAEEEDTGIERLEIQGLVAKAVTRLPRPSRDILLLRYYEDLTIREVANCIGLSRTATCHRLTKAQSELRAELRNKLGPQWATMFLPLAIPHGLFGLALLGLSPTAVGTGAVALLLGAAGLWMIQQDDRQPSSGEEMVALTPDAPGPADSDWSQDGEAERAGWDPGRFHSVLEEHAAVAEPDDITEGIPGGAWTSIHEQRPEGEPREYQNYGLKVATVGDLTGDGTADYLVTGFKMDDSYFNWLENGHRAPSENFGVVQLRDGATHRLLHSYSETELGDWGGSAIAALGDVDGDGVPDVAIGAVYAHRPARGLEWNGRVTIISGGTFEIVETLAGEDDFLGFGAGLASADLTDDDDEIPDLIVGVPGWSQPGDQVPEGKTGKHRGQVQVRNGKDLNEIRFTFEGQVDWGLFGAVVEAIGDVDGDGFPDLLVTAPQDSDEFESSGSFHLHSGKDGRPLAAPFHLEMDFTRLDDMAYLGGPDKLFLLAASGDEDPNRLPQIDWGDAQKGSVWVCKFVPGEDGELGRIEVVRPHEGEKIGAWLGQAVVILGDLNDDGVREYAYAAAGHGRIPDVPLAPGAVFICSGIDGTVLSFIPGPPPSEETGGYWGFDLAVLREGGPNEPPLLLVGNPGARVNGLRFVGKTDVIDFNPYLEWAERSVEEQPPTHVDFELDFPETEAGLPYAIMMSPTGAGPSRFAGAVVPLADDLQIASISTPEGDAFSNATGLLDAQGHGRATLKLGPMLFGPADSIWVAAMTFDPETLLVRKTSISLRLPRHE